MYRILFDILDESRWRLFRPDCVVSNLWSALSGRVLIRAMSGVTCGAVGRISVPCYSIGRISGRAHVNLLMVLWGSTLSVQTHSSTAHSTEEEEERKDMAHCWNKHWPLLLLDSKWIFTCFWHFLIKTANECKVTTSNYWKSSTICTMLLIMEGK